MASTFMNGSKLGGIGRLCLALASLLVCPWPASAAPASPASLCGAHERALFECPSRGKLIAVCASEGWTSDSGYVQYRFGRPGKTEVTVPERRSIARESMRVGVLGLSGGGADYASFREKEHVYTVYSAVSSRWGLKSGVAVDRSGERISVRRCDRGKEGEFPAALTTGTDLPPADDRFQLPP